MKLAPHLLWLSLFAACACAGAETGQTSARGETAIAAATGAILRGDADEAVRTLAAVPASEFSSTDAAFRACSIERFDRDAAPRLAGTGDAFVDEVLALYRDYWWHALKQPQRRDALAEALQRALRERLGLTASDDGDSAALDARLDEALRARGFHAQLGFTPPLRELMLWREQREKPYLVALPEGPQEVRVALLDGFVTRGWSAYGRCDRGSNGGWATDRKLYAVLPAYEKYGGLDSEAFRVVFLGHEAQHFADKHRFPDLASWELEYRAKLVELAMAREVSAKRLRSFMTAQGDDPGMPHPYANKRVVDALAARLGRSPDLVPIEALQEAARAELLADSARRNAGDGE